MFFSLIILHALVLQQQGRSHLVEAGPISGAEADTMHAGLIAFHDGADALETKAPVAGRHGGDGSAFELELHPERGSSSEADLADFSKYAMGIVGGLMDTKEDGAKGGLRGTDSETTDGAEGSGCVDIDDDCGLDDTTSGVHDTGCYANKKFHTKCASTYMSRTCCGRNTCIQGRNDWETNQDGETFFCSKS